MPGPVRTQKSRQSNSDPALRRGQAGSCACMLIEDSEFEAEQEKTMTQCDGRQALVRKGFVAEVS